MRSLHSSSERIREFTSVSVSSVPKKGLCHMSANVKEFDIAMKPVLRRTRDGICLTAVPWLMLS